MKVLPAVSLAGALSALAAVRSAGLAREFGVKTEAEAAAFASEIAWGCVPAQPSSPLFHNSLRSVSSKTEVATQTTSSDGGWVKRDITGLRLCAG